MNAKVGRDNKFDSRPAVGRSTDELLRIIEGSSDLKDVMAQIGGNLSEKTFSQRLRELMDARGVDPVWLTEHSLMSRAFVYQLCSGKRGPGRDIVLRLALLLKAGVPETQRMLCSAGRGALYPRVRRDAVILYALKEGMNFLDADDILLELGEEPLIES